MASTLRPEPRPGPDNRTLSLYAVVAALALLAALAVVSAIMLAVDHHSGDEQAPTPTFTHGDSQAAPPTTYRGGAVLEGELHRDGETSPTSVHVDEEQRADIDSLVIEGRQPCMDVEGRHEGVVRDCGPLEPESTPRTTAPPTRPLPPTSRLTTTHPAEAMA